MKSIFVVSLLLLCAISMSVAQDEPTVPESIHLEVFSGTNAWWIAVAINNAADTTSAIQLRDARSQQWADLSYVESWGKWTYSARGVAFRLPLSFRLRSASGEQFIITNALTSITGVTQTIDTGLQYQSIEYIPETDEPVDEPVGDEPVEDEPTEGDEIPAEDEPTEDQPFEDEPADGEPVEDEPTEDEPAEEEPVEEEPVEEEPAEEDTPVDPTDAPEVPSTQAPTHKPTKSPTQSPTKNPTQSPTADPTKSPTATPTKAATNAPANIPANIPANTPSSCSDPMKIMVPLYVYPGAAWDLLIAGSKEVETVAIINPNSGPGNGPNSAYLTYMQKMHDANVDMVGYVYTGWGNRDINLVKADIKKYATEFKYVQGIFLDEGATESSKVSYYQELYSYILSFPGFKYDVINPGTPPVPGYLSASSQMVTFEDYTVNLAAHTPPGYSSCTNKYNFVAIAHSSGVDDLTAVMSRLKTKQFGWVYVTDGAGGCCTYNKLTSYYPALVSAVAAANRL